MREDGIRYFSGHIYRGCGRGFTEGTVAVEDGHVVRASSVRSSGTIDGIEVERNVIVAPLFFNAHTHLGDSFMTEPVTGDLVEMVIPPDGIKHKRLRETSRERIAAGIREELKSMALSGTGYFCEYREGGCEGLEAMDMALGAAGDAREPVPAGLVLGRPTDRSGSDIADILTRSDGMGLNSLADFEPRVLDDMARAVKNGRKIFSAHHSEGKREPTELPIEFGIWPLVHMSCAHPRDIAAVADAGLPVAVCARSNLCFSLMPNVHRMLESGIELLVGTDNAFISRPDMFTELEVLWRTYMHMSPLGSTEARGAVVKLYEASLGVPLLGHGMDNLKGNRKKAFRAGHEIAVNGISEGMNINFQAVRNRYSARTQEIEYFMVNRATAMDIVTVEMPV